jgi:pyruvate,water dikinase
MSGLRVTRVVLCRKLCEGVGTIAAAFAAGTGDRGLSDFKSNEYANLIGGRQYEPHEENPMARLPRRLALHRRSVPPVPSSSSAARSKRVARANGLKNVQFMVPFVAHREGSRAGHAAARANGLKRGEHGLKIIMMCELPTNALLAERYLEYFDGMSIGSNDMTQLTLGLDRDSAIIAKLFDERDDAVKALLKMAIDACRKQGKYIGICGQGPRITRTSRAGCSTRASRACRSIPDTVVETWLFLAGNQPIIVSVAAVPSTAQQQAIVRRHRVLGAEREPVLAAERLQRLIVPQTHVRIRSRSEASNAGSTRW